MILNFACLTRGGAVIAGQQRLNVSGVNGIFNVSLDFIAGAFPGAVRSLEVAVRPAGGGEFTTLAPRQPINSAPYSIKSLSAANANNAARRGGVSSVNFVRQDAGGNVSIAGGLTINGALSLNTVILCLGSRVDRASIERTLAKGKGIYQHP